MIDVHPPHHTVSTWRDFFIHIATIVIGLLIAIGLEQTVEAIHHRHQRTQLVESLLEDTKATVAECERAEHILAIRETWVRQRIAQVRAALATHQPLIAPTPFPPETYDTSAAPSWSAAKSSGLLSVLSQDEVRAFGESAGLAEAVDALAPRAIEVNVAQQNSLRFQSRFSIPGSSTQFDFTPATTTDLREYLDLLLAQQSALNQFRGWNAYSRGAATAILEGSRDLTYIHKSESRFVPQTAN